MSESQVDVRIRAETGELQAGLQAAASSTQQAMERIRQFFAEAGERIRSATGIMGAAMSGLAQGMREGLADQADKLKGKLVELSGPFGKLTESLLNLPGPAKVAGAAIAALWAGNKMVETTARATEEAMDFGRALGITASQARVYQAAIADVGGSTSEFEGLARGMARNLRENEERMNALGLVTRDANGSLRPMNELVLEGIEVLGGYRQGADRALAAQDLFGRGLDASSKLMLLSKDAIVENQQAIEELGLEVGERSVAAWQEYDAASDRANLSMQGITKAIGDALMPAITGLIEMFNSIAPAAITVIRSALGGLMAAFYAVKNGVVVLWDTINAMVVSVAEPLRAVAEGVGRAITGDFAGAAAAIGNIGSNISGAWGRAMDSVAQSSQNTASRIKGLFTPDSAPGASGGKAGDQGYTPTPEGRSKKSKAGGGAGRGKGGDESHSGDWQRELDDMKLAFAQQQREAGTHHKFGLEAERQFWVSKLALAEAGSKDGVAARKKLHAIDEQLYKQRGQLQTQAAASERASAQFVLDMQQQDADQMLALGQISNEQRLEMQSQFEQMRYQIELKAWQERRALLEKENDPVAIAQHNEKKLELERKFQMKLRQVQSKQEQGKANPMLTMARDMQTGLQNALTAMLTRTQSFRQAIGNLFKGIYSTFVQEMVAKPLAQMAMRAVRETALWQAIFGTQMAGQSAASSQIVGIKAAETTTVVGKNAAQAASGAASALAGIPYVGPALAVAAAAAMMAMVMGMLGGGGDSSTTTTTTRIPSAAGGWDIPAGINPLTQLHEREMVLPAAQADAVRQMAEGGNGSQAPIVIHATGGDFIHKRDLARLLKGLKRDYRFA